MDGRDGAPAKLKCRYRYATGCTAEYPSAPGLHLHEKKAPDHAGHRVVLAACPVCGRGLGSEAQRSQHLTNEHAIRAGTEERQELDAQQTAGLYADLYGNPPAGPAAPALPAPSSNGHGPAPAELTSVQAAFAALVAEVDALVAENARLKDQVGWLQGEASVARQIRQIVLVEP
jgi:hypothetical protein